MPGDFLDFPDPFSEAARQLKAYAYRKAKQAIIQTGEALVDRAMQPVRNGVAAVKQGFQKADNAVGSFTAGVCAGPALLASESDWAGEAILNRYLRGLGDWHIRDDSRWTAYMQASTMLRAQVNEQLTTRLKSQIMKVKAGDKVVLMATFHADLENGEGIVGYQYLHGTNKDAGDFVLSASLHALHVSPGGNIEFSAVLRQTWNDRIDPNPIYTTDRIKNAYAEGCTLGRAAPFNIAITWSETRSLIWEARLQVLRSK
jgi:hypothetical protein